VTSEVNAPSTLEIEAEIDPLQKRRFTDALGALNRAHTPFLVAGAFGLRHYTGMWRGTKDMDLVVLPEDRESAIAALCGAGFRDLFPEEPYDRDWIFRATRDGVIVDLIWRLANKEDDIDRAWFDRGMDAQLFGQPVQMVSAADLCWMKLFVFQLRRCDWPDIINVIRGTRGRLDWEQLLREVGPHWRLLCALVNIYDWLCPPERSFIPDAFRERLEELRALNTDAAPVCRRDLFDSRPWLTRPGAGLGGIPPNGKSN
jgi:hypothetical protein